MLLELLFSVFVLVVMSESTAIPAQGSQDVCKVYTDQLAVQVIAVLNETTAKCDSNQQGAILVNDLLIKYETAKQQYATALNNLQARYENEKQELVKELKTCKAIPAKYPKTCLEWKLAGYLNDGDYVIDPDGPGGVPQFQVECNMKDDHHGNVVTIIHHDAEARTAVPKCQPVHCHAKGVKYYATLAQIVSLIQQSLSCEQFIKYDCHGSVLLSPHQYGSHAAWYSRNGAQMDYWGGAKPGTKKCACGMKNSCDSPKFVCNCDINDAVWRSDSGYITDMNALPVTKMTFGDTDGSNENGFYRLGPLRCYK